MTAGACAGEWEGPVAIGGVGGSGTRVVAEIVMRLGFYLGWDLTPANDNVWFTVLLKHPRWYAAGSGPSEASVRRALRMLERAMRGRLVPSPTELGYLARAVLDLARHGDDHLGSRSGAWPLVRAWNMLRAGSRGVARERYRGWGWKEPNTHVVLAHLAEHFPGLRYIHVMRHGLDMAFSENQAQLHNWGALFGIDPGDASVAPELRSLRYWLAANERAIALGEARLGARFRVVRLETLCRAPGEEIAALGSFLGAEVAPALLDELARLPRVPSTLGRHRGEDLSVFPPEDLARLRGLGYEIEDAAAAVPAPGGAERTHPGQPGSAA